MILLDTDVLISHLRGHDAARSWLRDTRARGEVLAVSSITIAEIVGGMRSPERHEVSQLLDSMQCLAADRQIGEVAGQLRRRFHRSHGHIGIADYLIAATAQTTDCPLATLNVKHFPMFDGLVPPFRQTGT